MMNKDIIYGIDSILSLAQDVNRKEIASHIENDSLGDWCNAWSTSMGIALSFLKNGIEQMEQ